MDEFRDVWCSYSDGVLVVPLGCSLRVLFCFSVHTLLCIDIDGLRPILNVPTIDDVCFLGVHSSYGSSR